MPILKKDYIVCIMEDLAQNLKTILGDDAFSSFISKIDEGKSNHEKIAMFLLLEKYNKDFDTFTDGFVNYPVIRSRMINIHDDFSTNTRAYLNLSERYEVLMSSRNRTQLTLAIRNGFVLYFVQLRIAKVNCVLLRNLSAPHIFQKD